MSDVAALAGVSVMTVSRALREPSTVSEELRRRVLSAAAQLRYQPNEIARSLREQRSRQIGVVVPYLLDPFFAICAHAVGEVAKAYAYSMVLSTSNEDPEVEFREVCQMARRNVEGLVVIPAQARPGDSLLLRPELAGVPITLVDRPLSPGNFDCVLVDNFAGVRRGIEHLVALQHRRISFIGFRHELYTLMTRYEGYKAAMKAASLPPHSVLISSEVEDALRAVRGLMASARPPTALFCGNNLIARHVLHGLKEIGCFPPTPVALVSFDDFELADLVRPGITAVRQPAEEMGRRAAEMLFRRLRAQEPADAETVMLATELIVRGSCGSLELSRGDQRFRR